MNILNNAWTAITAVFTLLGGLASIIALRGFLKKRKGFNMKAISENPYKNTLFWAICGTMVGVFLFYVFGGFDKPILNNAGKQAPVPTTKSTIVPAVVKRDTPKIENNTIRHKSYVPIVPKKHTAKEEPKEDLSVHVDRSPGSINVGGKNNNVYINADRKLTPQGLEMVRKSVDSTLLANNSTEKKVVVLPLSNCNVPLIIAQLSEYFTNNGYDFVTGTNFGAPLVNGFDYSFAPERGRVRIEIGYFK